MPRRRVRELRRQGATPGSRRPARRRDAAHSLRVLAAAGAAALLLSACGSSNVREISGTYAGEGGLPAPYLSVGPLAYQVQISRALNPADTEDSAYLTGLTPAQAKLSPGEEWFGVFMQVFNETGHPHPASPDITLYDTQGNVYRPIVPPGVNLFVYKAADVPAHSRLPEPGSPADTAPTQGELLLFKIRLESLSNRPIDVKIANPANPAESASAELDV
jgi:hypothetical protein